VPKQEYIPKTLSKLLGTSKRILIVDDEPYNIFSLKILISLLKIPFVCDIIDEA